MERAKRKFTNKFKIEKVRLISAGESSAAEVAEDLGVDRSLIEKWHEQYADDAEQTVADKGQGKPEEQDASTDTIKFLKGFIALFWQHKTVVLAISTTYAVLVYYNNSSLESINPALFPRYIILVLVCTFLLALPLWIAHIVFSIPEGRLGGREILKYLRDLVLVSFSMVFVGWSGNSTVIKTLLAPVICPTGYEGSEIGFFARPDLPDLSRFAYVFTTPAPPPFCRGDFGTHITFLPNDTFLPLLGCISVLFFISLFLLIAAWCMRRVGVRSAGLVAAVTAVLYLGILGSFSYKHLAIRPYAQPINNFINKRHYGNFLVNEALSGHADRVKRVLDAGVDPNLKNYLGWAPMVSAALTGHAEVVELLLDYGGDPFSTDSRMGKTALDYAYEQAEKGNTEFTGLVERMEQKAAGKTGY